MPFKFDSSISFLIIEFFKVDDTKYDLVIHLAAIVGGRATIEGNPLSVATDLAIDSDFFNWALITRPGRIVYFSSSAAYPTKYQGTDDWVKLNESMIDLDNISNPDLTYGWSKLTGEYLAKFVQEAGIPVHIFRPFSGYGTDQSLDYPFPSYIKRAKDRMDPFEIWGSGQQDRNFTYVSDIVEGLKLACENITDCRSINIGTSEITKIADAVQTVCDIMGYKPADGFFFDTSKPEGVHARAADTRNQELWLGWKPSVSFKDGITKTIEWYQANRTADELRENFERKLFER